MALIRTLFWAAIFVGSTFAFTVLFEHGPTNFAQNAKEEAHVLQAMMNGKQPKKDGKGGDDKPGSTTK